MNAILVQTERFYFKKPSEPADSGGKNIALWYIEDVMERKQFALLTVLSVNQAKTDTFILWNFIYLFIF